MKYLTHVLLLVSLVSTTFFSACSSSKTEDPAPSTGTVNGVITPAGAVTTVTATNSASQTKTATPNAGGSYEIGGLASGTYTLTFTAATGYVTPAPQTVTVTAGNTTTAAIVIATAGSGNAGSATWTANGVVSTSTLINAALQSGDLTISLGDLNTSTQLLIKLHTFNEATAASYTLGGTDTTLGYTILSNSASQLWVTYVAGGSGTVTITSVDATTRKVSGTFSATAPAFSNATGTKTVTGSFTNITYQ